MKMVDATFIERLFNNCSPIEIVGLILLSGGLVFCFILIRFLIKDNILLHNDLKLLRSGKLNKEEFEAFKIDMKDHNKATLEMMDKIKTDIMIELRYNRTRIDGLGNS